MDTRRQVVRLLKAEAGGPVNFMLVDIWEVALPALELVSPSLRPGAIVVTDNTVARADRYHDYFE